MVYKAQDGISSEDLKRIANEQIMEKIKEIARTVYKEENKKEMEELIKFKKFFNKWELWVKINYKNKKIKEKSLSNLLSDKNGNNLWWMSPLAEKNY